MEFSPAGQSSELLMTVQPTKKNSFLIFHALGRTIWLYILCAWIGLPALLLVLGLDGGMVIVAAIVLFVIIWAISFFISRMQLNNIVYKFYNDKVEYSDGFLVKSKKNILYSRMTNTEQWQGIIERLFSLGHIYLDTAGTGWHELTLKYMDNTEVLYEKINQLIHQGSK